MEDGCTAILHDINADQAKAALVLPALNRLIAKSALIEDKIIFGTWFGCISKVDRSVFAHHEHEAGHAWLMPALDPAHWRVELLENGTPIGSPQTLHADIRERGLGAWSHWDFQPRTRVMFSTSDNSDPNVNGSKYELKVYPR